MRAIGFFSGASERMAPTGKIACLTIRLMVLAVFGPTDLMADRATSTSITLTWTAPGDDGNSGTASEYDIRYSTVPLSAENWDQAMKIIELPKPQPAGSVETLTVDELEPATQYYFGVKTADEVPNWSFMSNVVARQTLETTLPAPVGISPTDAGYARDNRPYLVVANVNLDEDEDVYYYFEISLNSDFSTRAVYSDGIPAGTKYTLWQVDKTLANGVTYYWRVRVQAGSNIGAWSPIYSFAVDQARANRSPSVPEAQYPPYGDTMKVEPPSFAWSNAVDQDDDQLFYELEVYDLSGTALLEKAVGIGQDPGPSSSFTSRYQFSDGNWYRWRIRAFDGTDFSSWSGISYFVHVEYDLPDPITDLMAETGEQLGELVLTWTVPEGAEDYQIFYSRDTLQESHYRQATVWSDPPQPEGTGKMQTFSMYDLVPGGQYWVAMVVLDGAGYASHVSNITSGVSGYDFGSDTDDEETTEPVAFQVEQNYPNPFNPTTHIQYTIPCNCPVSVQIFNILGQLTAGLVDEIQPSGIHTVVWDGTDHQGKPVASGIYVYRVATSGQADTKKMVLLK